MTRSLFLRAPRVLRGGIATLLLAAAALASFLAAPAHAAPLGNTLSPALPVGFVKTQLAHGLKNPTVFAFAPNGDIYIGEQGGTILIYRNGAVLPTPVVVLNTDGSAEKGLLGMALDPNFATNGYLYVSYTTPDEHAQLSRLTVQNGVASLASEHVILKGNQLQNPHHSANDLHIGPDGKLWWTVGDNVPAITNAQTLTNIYGKILRFNLDGTIPSDNPFVHIPGAVPSIYAFGLRNPFRFAFLPTGQPIELDTGSNYWEELNVIQRGGNYGWDLFEGNCGSCGAINPVYAYGHLPVDGAGSAIAAYAGTAFGPQYAHVVFFGDYNRQDIEAVTFDPTYHVATSDVVFDNSAGTIADLQEGPDGDLYYVSIFEGTFTKIAPTGQGAAVVHASAQPHRAVAAASTPPSVTLTAPAVGTTYNGGDTITFSATGRDGMGNALPASAYSWSVDFYSYGVAEPFYTYEAPHPFYGPITGVTSGSFTIPQDLSNTAETFYRLTLTVTDAQGAQTTVQRDLHPNTTIWGVTTNVPGAGYFVDGTWQTAPYTLQDGVSIGHVLSGMPLQTINGVRYRFVGWSDGSALTDSFTTTATTGTLTARYEPVTGTMPSGWISSDIGTPLVPGTADYSSASGSFYVDGAGADIFGTNDQFHYVYQALNGNGTITARVRYQTDPSPWTKAGVMIKQSTTAGDLYVDALTTPTVSPTTPNINGVGCNPNGCASPLPPIMPTVGYGVRMQYDFKGSQSPKVPLTTFNSPNEWLRLQRIGNTFTSWYSTDGTTWTLIGKTTVAMNTTVTIGLFVTSHNIGQPSSVAFDNVSIVPGP